MLIRTGFAIGFSLILLVLSRSSHAQMGRPEDRVYYPANTSTVAIEGMTLIDGAAGTAIDDAVLVVENGIVRSTGRRGNVTVPTGAQRVNAAGKTIMPAIYALHSHIGRNRADSTPRLVDGDTMAWGPPRVEQTRESIQIAANASPSFGVTHITSLGYDQAAMTAFIADQRAGNVPGAVVYSSGNGFSAPGGWRAAPAENADPEIHLPTTPEQARQMVDQEAKKQLGPISFTKMWVTDERNLPAIAPDVFAAIIDQSHRHGKKVVAHTYSPQPGQSAHARGDRCDHAQRPGSDRRRIHCAGKKAQYFDDFRHRPSERRRELPERSTPAVAVSVCDHPDDAAPDRCRRQQQPELRRDARNQ